MLANEFNFTEMARTDCVLVDILDDEVVELSEMFSIVLTLPAGDQFRLGIPGSGAVTITDNDGKIYSYHSIVASSSSLRPGRGRPYHMTNVTGGWTPPCMHAQSR